MNYADGTELEYGKIYTFKTLNGSAIKKITYVSGAKVTISGTKVTPKLTSGWTETQIMFTLKDGTKFSATYVFKTSKEKEEAISIVEKAASEAGISTDSTDLDKAMFIYNWLGENCTYSLSTKTGHYYAIRTGKGNCSAYSEAVQLMGEVLKLQVVEVETSDGTHDYNGMRVNGKWYLTDTSSCEAWDFVVGQGQFLLSYSGRFKTFKVSSNSLADITFDNTEYDDCSVWAEYRNNYHSETEDDDFWDQFINV